MWCSLIQLKTNNINHNQNVNNNNNNNNNNQSRKLVKCFLHSDLKLDRLVIVCKFGGISSQRRGSEINMELNKEEVLEDWCKSLVTTNLLC